MILRCVNNDIKYVVINYTLNNSSKNGCNQCQLVRQDQHKNQSVQTNTNMMRNAKMEHHVNFDNLAEHDNLFGLK